MKTKHELISVRTEMRTLTMARAVLFAAGFFLDVIFRGLAAKCAQGNTCGGPKICVRVIIACLHSRKEVHMCIDICELLSC